MRTKVFIIVIAVLAVLLVSCGQKDKESEPAKTSASTAESEPSAALDGNKEKLGKTEPPVKSYVLAENPCREAISTAGFEPVAYGPFPFSREGQNGEMVAYRTAADGGGLIFVKTIDGQTAPSWHWYFHDAVPDSAYPFEINEDGLWDLRVIMKDGQVREFLQGATFTLDGGLRGDWIALNGNSSPASDTDHELWHCFDGNPRTAWRASLVGREEVFIEVNTPFGLNRGVLTVHTQDQGQPKECRLILDGQEVQRFELQNKSARQRIQIKNIPQNVKTARLAVMSVHGAEQDVVIAEFSLE